MFDPLISAQQMETILDIGRQLTSGVTLDALLHRVAAAAAVLTNSELALILLAGEPDGQLRCTAVTLFEDRLLDIPVPLEGSIAGLAYCTGEAVIANDVQQDPRYYPNIEDAIQFQARALLAVPLQYKDRKIGVLEIENRPDNSPFGQAEIDILTLLASQATVAIENQRLYQAGQRQLAELTQAEEELRQHRLQLEEVVAARTNELTMALAASERFNYQLQQEIAERELLIGDLRSFSHMVAHDIKGPLGLVLGYAHLLKQGIDRGVLAELNEWNEAIVESTLKLNKIVDDLLLLADLRQEDVTLCPCHSGLIVAGALARLKGEIASSGAQVQVPAQWPVVLGHAQWIEEIWYNYLSNAIKYGGKPPRIELGAEPVEAPAAILPEIRFWVRDNGQGITAEHQGRLFMEFERFDRSQAGGHGFGLAIVKRIAEKLGGQVGAESTPGQGTRFWFTLPETSDFDE